ncbi:transcriptional regulator [Clostridium sp. YIM B02515]|uniref:Transcriptional regulator n=1 Tax=Clostridium rhizosphaerae TaxID=2803861 RepID=A0ABS1T8R9_9CLOT|nr:transcriptional regulator [Clostridium rhizosphaerae]MBL4935729.1 transcriptional regulator [Clostridium rhizosphaerae]
MSKLSHLAEILITLQYKSFVTALELSEILGVDKKTVYRYIDNLIEANIPIQTRKGRNGGIYLEEGFFMKSPRLTIEELESLLLAEKILTKENGFAYEDTLKSAVGKVKNVSRLKIDKKLSNGIMENLDSIDDKFYNILLSIEKGRAVEIEYLTAAKDSLVKAKVDPYTVIYRMGEWHLIGYEHNTSVVKSFYVRLISKIKITNLVFIKPADFSLGNFIKDYFGVFYGNNIEVKIKFSESLKSFISRTKWHASQEVQEMEDGSLMLSFFLDELSEIKNWVMGFGSAAEVIEPLLLREEIKHEIHKLSVLYD